MRYLRTNTATRITVGPFLDQTDGITPEVALTVTSEKLTFVCDTAGVPTLILDVAPTASGGSNDMVHITGDDSGYYDLELAAADVNYLGRALLSLNNVAAHCPVFHEFMILPAMVYDSMILATDDLDTNTKKWNDLTTVALPLVPATAGRTLVVDAAGLADSTAVKVGPTGAATAQTAGDLYAKSLAWVQSFLRSDVTADATIGGPFVSNTMSLSALYTNALTAATIAAAVTATVRLTKNVAFPNFHFTMYNLDGTLATTLLAANVSCFIQKDTGTMAAVSASPVAIVDGGAVKTGAFRVDLSQAEMNGTAIAFIATATGFKPTSINIICQQ